MSASLLELSLPNVLQLHSVTKEKKDFVGIVTRLQTRKAAYGVSNCDRGKCFFLLSEAARLIVGPTWSPNQRVIGAHVREKN
jgi:hypothetical protein